VLAVRKVGRTADFGSVHSPLWFYANLIVFDPQQLNVSQREWDPCNGCWSTWNFLLLLKSLCVFL